MNEQLNNLTEEQIKSSAQCKWYKYQAKIMLIIFAIIAAVSLMVALFMGLTGAPTYDAFYVSLAVGGGSILLYGSAFLPFVFYYNAKSRYLLKNYASMPLYVATLNTPHTAYWYRYSVYFTVELTEANGDLFTADTTPLFSSSPFAAVSLEDYSNKQVHILYDQTKDKAYVIDLV